MAAKRKTIYKVSSVVIIILGILILIAGSIITEPTPKHTKVGTPTQQIANKQVQPQQRDHRTSTLSFAPTSSIASPIVTKQGETVTVEVMLDPGQNLVSFAKLDILYDPTKLAIVQPDGFQPTDALPSLLNGPIYTSGKISATMSIGADPKKGIEKSAKIATIAFKALTPTGDGDPTVITFGPDLQILSLAPEDGASENVYLSGTTALVAIE